MRLEISRRAELAVRALAVLGRAEGHVKAAELAEAVGTTAAFVPQIVAPLVRAGWVGSDPGPTGGYVGRVDLDEMSVLAVIEAVDGVTDAGRCVVAERLCDGGAPCALHAAWSRARRELVGVLGGTTVASVAVVAP